jgi:hypothetical protein
MTVQPRHTGMPNCVSGFSKLGVFIICLLRQKMELLRVVVFRLRPIITVQRERRRLHDRPILFKASGHYSYQFRSHR